MHARAMVSMLDMAVHMIGPDLDIATAEILELGERHVDYGVQADHYPVVGEALILTLRQLLGPEIFTLKVQKSWAAFFGFISLTMIKGAANAVPKEEVFPAPVVVVEKQIAALTVAVVEKKEVVVEKASPTVFEKPVPVPLPTKKPIVAAPKRSRTSANVKMFLGTARRI
jgi:hypothetical protein